MQVLTGHSSLESVIVELGQEKTKAEVSHGAGDDCQSERDRFS